MPAGANAVWHRLAQGRSVRGTVLAEELGVSRAAVWNQIQWLREAGVGIEADRVSGYRIPGGMELLSARHIEKALAETGVAGLGALEVYGLIDSTNRVAQLWGARDYPSGSVCLAEGQSGGRGRFGRRWQSPLGAGIWLSLLWRFQAPLHALGGISLAVAIAVIDALEKFGLRDLRIKWPNDIQWRGRKLGGVLLDLHGDPGGDCYLVIGIGLNVELPRERMRLDQEWTDLGTVAGARLSRNALVAAMLSHLLPMAANYQRGGFADWRERWRQLDAVCGREVVLRSADQTIRGVADGVDADGMLKLLTDTGMLRIGGGELSLRIAE